MKSMPLNVVFGAIFFLQSLGKELMKHTLNSLTRKAHKMNPQQKETLMKILDGGQHFIPLVREI